MRRHLGMLLLAGSLVFWAGMVVRGLREAPAEASSTPTDRAAAAFPPNGEMRVYTVSGLALTLSADTRVLTLARTLPDDLQICAEQSEGPPTCVSLLELRERRD